METVIITPKIGEILREEFMEPMGISVQRLAGMNTSIGDDAAIVFTSQFYSSISFGKSIAAAF